MCTGWIGPTISVIIRIGVHPRAYGADLRSHQLQNLNKGSSPCVRGRSCKSSSSVPTLRLIPVHTGQICVVLSLSERAKVHPRAYEADESSLIISAVSVGSSPCIRGGYSRIVASALPFKAHPREYGADPLPPLFCDILPGSSP